MKSDDPKARYRRANIDEQRRRRQKRRPAVSVDNVGRHCRPSLLARMSRALLVIEITVLHLTELYLNSLFLAFTYN